MSDPFDDAVRATRSANVPVDAWAYRAMIKEAYGFSIPAFVKNLLAQGFG